MTDMNPLQKMAKYLSLPQLVHRGVEFHGENWTVYFYKEFASALEESDKFTPEFFENLNHLTNYNHQSQFRLQMTFKTIPFLVGVFCKKREIRLYSSRLGRELFLIENLECLGKKKEYGHFIEGDHYKDFKVHTELVAGLHAKYFPTVYHLATHKFDLPQMMDKEELLKVEEKSRELMEKLGPFLSKYRPSWFEIISNFGLDLTTRYQLIRIHMLKFVAILPSLDEDKRGIEVKRILLESLRRLTEDSQRAKKLKKKGEESALPNLYLFFVFLIFWISRFLPALILAKIVRSSVRFMAKRFIAGESIETSENSLKALFSSQRDVTLDQLGELVVSEAEADHYMNEVIKLIRGLKEHIPRGMRNAAGINRAHVSIKVSALCSDFKPHAFEYTFEHVKVRLTKILLEAKEQDVFINIDAEHYDYRDIVFKIYSKVLLENEELKDFSGTGIVLQSYLRDSYEHLLEIVEFAKKRGVCMPLRLVKGAYWDAETVEADAHGFNAPEFLNKEETDLHFRQMIIKIFDFHPHVQLALASHNYSDHCFARALKVINYPELPEIEHQCLHMTYEALSVGMAKMGWVVRNYVPVGGLLVGMAYLVRRIMENSSQVGVLTMMRSHKNKSVNINAREVHQSKIENGKIFRDLSEVGMTSEFFNTGVVRLYVERELDFVKNALDKFKNEELGKIYGNDFLDSGELSEIYSNSDSEILVGKIQFASKEDAKNAIGLSENAYESGKWANSSWIERSSLLVRAADIMLVERLNLCALIVYESGKSIPEAMADVDEAIDFLNYYAREEGKHHQVNSNAISRGPVGVIAPWNFPLAIPCGMAAAALVSGNTVLLKSAEQTPLVAQRLTDILHSSGVPKDVLIHLPGFGEVVGEEIVDDPRISSVSFTGSKAVGMAILKKMSSRIYENKLFKTSYPARAIVETGGKNAIIVTANAELDETVSGILYSAFAHAGQKCSAASRIIVHHSVKERLVQRLKEALSDIEVRRAFDLSCSINPIVSLEDRDRLRRAALEAREEAEKFGGRVIIDRTSEELPGFCVGPALFEIPLKRALKPASFAQRELFGPIVHIISYRTLKEALEVFNSSAYALTGGVFGQSQDDIDFLTQSMECGNIYVNRSITGARVAIEPFGGFKLSGTGPKAGGKGYIPHLHVNLNQKTYAPRTLEEGSDYRIELIDGCPLAPRLRRKKMLKFTGIILHHFEALFQGIHGEDKTILKKFNKWLGRNLVDFQEREHFNRRIPGQISYNDFNKRAEHALVISTLEAPSFLSLMQVLGALSVGLGVTICARNQKSYTWWSQILDCFVKTGFSNINIDVYFASDAETKRVLSLPLLSYVIFDAPIEDIKTYSKHLYGNVDEVLRMRKVITPFDAASLQDFRRLLASYSWIRSFAVNTMRHGAPMDLEL